MRMEIVQVFFFVLAGLLSGGHCDEGVAEMSGSYSCFTADKCTDSEQTVAFYGDEKYCCKSGDAVSLNIKGPGFSYSSNVVREADVRDDGNATGSSSGNNTLLAQPEEGQGDSDTTVECTCNAVDVEELEKSVLHEINQMHQEMREFYNGFYHSVGNWLDWRNWF